jgi:hypothetical protein
MGSSQISTYKNKNSKFEKNKLVNKEDCRKTCSYSINLSGNPVHCILS